MKIKTSRIHKNVDKTATFNQTIRKNSVKLTRKEIMNILLEFTSFYTKIILHPTKLLNFH